MVHDDVSKLRAIAAGQATPLPPVLASAIIAVEDPVSLRPPRFSPRSLLPSRQKVIYCGPASLALKLVKYVSPPRRSLFWRIDSSVATYVVARLFSPEDLLRIYAHEIYLGKVSGRSIYGVEPASRVYFGKDSRDLTPAEAATIAAMIRSPNVFSPVKYPERSRERRDQVLALMLHYGFIDKSEFRRSVAEQIQP